MKPSKQNRNNVVCGRMHPAKRSSQQPKEHMCSPQSFKHILAAVIVLSFPSAVQSFSTTDGWRSSAGGKGFAIVGALKPSVAFATGGLRWDPTPRYHRHLDLDTSRMYKNTIDETTAFADERIMSDFERRMRRAALGAGGGQYTTKTKKAEKKRGRLPSNVRRVETLEEYKVAVGDESERIVVVRFFATWCKSCRAMAPYFYRLAETNPNISFVEVPITAENSVLHQGLGVPSIPFGHIYHPQAGLVEEMKISRKAFPRFEKVVRSYVDGLCELPDGDCSNPYNEKTKETATASAIL